MKSYFATIIVLVFFSCSPSINMESIDDIAVDYFYNYDKEIMEEFKLPIKPIEIIKESVKYDGIIDSPILNTKFHKYTYKGLEPNVNLIIINNRDLSEVLYNKIDDDTLLVTENTLIQLNRSLAKENKFDQDKFMELVIFIIKNVRERILILNSINEIEIDDNHKIEETLKNIISPPKWINTLNEFNYSFYCWDYFSSNLFKVSFIYTDFKINVRQKFIMKVGVPHIKI